jgi:hypothetical protein
MQKIDITSHYGAGTHLPTIESVSQRIALQPTIEVCLDLQRHPPLSLEYTWSVALFSIFFRMGSLFFVLNTHVARKKIEKEKPWHDIFARQVRFSVHKHCVYRFMYSRIFS